MNVPIRQDAKQMRRLHWSILTVIVLAIAAYGGIHLYTRDTTQKSPISWDGMPAVLDSAIRSAEYQEGGGYLSNPNLLTAASLAQRDAYSYRLAVDFLRALTPEQVEALHQGRNLPYTKLRLDQQRALIRLSASRVAGVDLSNAVNESFVVVSTVPARQIASFGWLNPVGKGQDSIYFHITFSAGKASFDSPYHHR